MSNACGQRCRVPTGATTSATTVNSLNLTHVIRAAGRGSVRRRGSPTRTTASAAETPAVSPQTPGTAVRAGCSVAERRMVAGTGHRIEMWSARRRSLDPRERPRVRSSVPRLAGDGRSAEMPVDRADRSRLVRARRSGTGGGASHSRDMAAGGREVTTPTSVNAEREEPWGSLSGCVPLRRRGPFPCCRRCGRSRAGCRLRSRCRPNWCASRAAWRSPRRRSRRRRRC